MNYIIPDYLVSDVINIGNGAFYPVKGFMHKNDYESVLNDMRLSDGSLWPIPIVLDVNDSEIVRFLSEDNILLTDEHGLPIAELMNISVYPFDKKYHAKKVFGTSDDNHPGVQSVYEMNDYLVGGDIKLISNKITTFNGHYLTPFETKNLFKKNKWKTIVAFQTRNVPHRGHEYLQMKALEEADGLLVQPVIGEKKIDDFKDEYIIAAYEILIDKYYPKNRAALGILPLRMRYAGPKEALMHALIRRNYGCTHFIVGRDHAGVRDYYGPYEAQELLDSIDRKELKIEILKYPEVIYSKDEKNYKFVDELKDNEDYHKFSGTKLRSYIKEKDAPPEYIIRKEIYDLLINGVNTLVDDPYKYNTKVNGDGFVLWFTGLSQSGKSTIAREVYDQLIKKGVKIERLDGDVVRETLTSDLGFSKEDRDENIRRVGFVSKLLSQNGVNVIASFISPYKKQRDELRSEIKHFIEIYVDTPIEICEKRDKKGLYKKARAGEIKNFTGISDPYEAPKNPEIELYPEIESIEESVDKILRYLYKNNFISS